MLAFIETHFKFHQFLLFLLVSLEKVIIFWFWNSLCLSLSLSLMYLYILGPEFSLFCQCCIAPQKLHCFHGNFNVSVLLNIRT